jgi:hypothetical protein
MTIKTQLVEGQRRIITKVVNGQRRVSCSCCPSEEGCCMYPAAAVESGLIALEDLPNEIFSDNFGNPVSYFKVESPIDASGFVGVPYLVYYGTLGDGVGIETGSGLWSGQVDFDIAIFRACLISYILDLDNGLVPDPDWYVDAFSDTYSFETASGITLGTIARDSLCFWSGLTNFGCGVELFYLDDAGATNFFSLQPHKWYVRLDFFNEDVGCLGEPAFYLKDGFQNEPFGEYSNLETGSKLTVSEP